MSALKWVALGCGLISCLGVMGTAGCMGLALIGVSQASKQVPTVVAPNPPEVVRDKPYVFPSAPSTATTPGGATSDDDDPEDPDEGADETGIGQALVKDTIGDFTLTASTPATKDYPGVATEAVRATYSSPGGAEITHLIIRCKDAATADSLHSASIAEMERRAYQVVSSSGVKNESGEEIGKRTLLEGPNQTVLWTNRYTFCMAAGPKGDAQEFQKACPY